MKRFSIKPKRFIAQNRRGAIMVLTAILLPILIGSLGLAVDTGNLQLDGARVSKALDAAAIAGVLTATTGTTTENARLLAEKVGNYNLKRSGFTTGSVSVEVTSVNGQTQVTASGSGIQANVFFLTVLGLGRTIELKEQAARAVRTPALVALVLDTSASMNDKFNGTPKIDLVKDAAKKFVGAFDLQLDRMAIIGFGNQGRIYFTMPEIGESQNQGALFSAIDELAPDGATNIAEGISLGRSEIERVLPGYGTQPVIKVIVLVSDGAPTVYRANFVSSAVRAGSPADEGFCDPKDPDGIATDRRCWSPWHLKDWKWTTDPPKPPLRATKNPTAPHPWDDETSDIATELNKATGRTTRTNYHIILHGDNDPNTVGWTTPPSKTWPLFNGSGGNGFETWEALEENPGHPDIPGQQSGYNYLVWKNFALWSNNDPLDTELKNPLCADDAARFPLWTPGGSNWFGKSPLRDCLKELASLDTAGNLHDDFKSNIAYESGSWNPLKYNNWYSDLSARLPSMFHFPFYAALREAELAKRKPNNPSGLEGNGIQIYTVGIGQTDYIGPKSSYVGCFKAEELKITLLRSRPAPTSEQDAGNMNDRCEKLPISPSYLNNQDEATGGPLK